MIHGFVKRSSISAQDAGKCICLDCGSDNVRVAEQVCDDAFGGHGWDTLECKDCRSENCGRGRILSVRNGIRRASKDYGKIKKGTKYHYSHVAFLDENGKFCSNTTRW